MPKLAVQSFQADGATPAVAFNVPTVRPPPLLRLDKLPYPALPENIPKLENTSGEKFANNEAPFPALTGRQSTYISNQVKASLDRAIEQGMIKPVPIGTPVTWCSPMLLYQKQMEPLAIPLIFSDSMHSVFEKPITLYHHSSFPLKYHLTPKSLYLILYMASALFPWTGRVLLEPSSRPGRVLLCCQCFSHIRSDMLGNACELAKTDVNLLSDKLLTKPLLYGDHTFNNISNQLILQGTITFIRLSEGFKIDDPSP